MDEAMIFICDNNLSISNCSKNVLSNVNIANEKWK